MPSAKRIALELKHKDYLIGKTLQWKRIAPDSKKRELCVFCWEPLRASDSSRNEGFVQPEYDDWVCFPCLNAFLDVFNWQIEWPEEPLQLDDAGFPTF